MKRMNNGASMFLNDFKTKANLTNAELISITGISQSSIYEYLRYEREPSLTNLLKLKQSLGISTDVILTWDMLDEFEREQNLSELIKNISNLKVKHFVKTDLSDYFKNKRISMSSKEELYFIIKELYYTEKRKIG